MHSPDCRSTWNDDSTNCYCGFNRYRYYERVVNDLMSTLSVWWGPCDRHDQDVEELKTAAIQHVAWKRLACELLAVGTDIDVDLWLEEKNAPLEILERPEVVQQLVTRLRSMK